MQRPPSDLIRSARVKEMFEACKEALRIIGEIDLYLVKLLKLLNNNSLLNLDENLVI